MRKLGLDSSQPNFQNLSPVPQTQVVVAFEKTAIDKFFDSGIGEDTQDLKVFSKGDGRLISFTHELGANEGGKAKNEISIKFIDYDNYFTNSLFDRKFDDVINQARDIVGLEPRDNPVSNTAKPSQFDYQEELNEAIKGGVPKFYIAYGLGSNTNHWAGPFVCHLVNGIYQESGNDVLTLELKFIPEFRSDIVPKQTDDKGNQVDTEVQSTVNVAQFLFNTTGERNSTQRRIEKVQVRWLIENLQLTLEQAILKYLEGCGYTNVLLMFSDVEKIMEDNNYDTFTGLKQIRWDSKYRDPRNVRIDDSSNLGYHGDIDAWYDLNQIFDLLGLELSFPELSTAKRESQRIAKENKSIYTQLADARIDSADFGFKGPNLDRSNIAEVNWISNPFITEQYTYNEEVQGDDNIVNQKDNVTYGITLKKPKEGQSVFKPVMDLLKNFQDHVLRLVTPYVGVEANALIVDEWRKAHPDYIPDPDEPVIVIGEEALIQKVLYHKENNLLRVSDYIKPEKNSVVSFIANQADAYRAFMKQFHVTKRGKSFFDYDSNRLPDEYGYTDNLEVERFAVPVFKINTQNPNVLRFTAKSKGIFFSTLASTCQTIATFVKESLNPSVEKQNYQRNLPEKFKQLTARVLDRAHNEGNTNDVYDFMGSTKPDFFEIASDISELVFSGAPIGPSPISTGKSPTAFLAYINNFFRMFRHLHQCSVKTVPYFNLSELSILNEKCILLKNLVSPVAEPRGDTKSIYTGIWAFRGFKHVLSNTDAYSEFYLYKTDPFQIQRDPNTVGAEN